MQAKLIFTGATAIAAASLVGVALLSFSPVACGCESVPDLLLASAGMSYPAELPKPQRLESGLDTNLKGRTVKGGGDPYYFGGCEQASTTQVSCHIPTGKSRLLERGYDIVFVTDSSGLFIKSHVSGYTRWL